jgi:PAS domain S-box-containing protein
MPRSPRTREELMQELTKVKSEAAQLKHLEAERRRVAEALRESEAMFQKITEKSIVGVYLIQDEMFRYVNPYMAELFGYAVHELVDHRGPKDVVLDEDWSIVQENLRKRIAGEMESINYRFRGKKAKGEMIHLEVYGSGTDYQGKPAVIGTILDITDSVEAQHTLQMQLDRFRALYHIAMAMAAEHSLEENLALLVNNCRKLLKADVSLIAVPDETLERLLVCAQSGLRRRGMKHLPMDLLKQESPERISDVSQPDAEACFEHLKSSAKKQFGYESLSSGLAIPLRSRQTPLGVLCVANRSRKVFSESEKDLLCLMGNIAALEISRKHTEERLAQSQNELRHLSVQLLRAQEDERKRLAQELHDGIGQSISAIKFMIETSLKQIRENPEAEITGQLEMLLPMVQSTVEEVQRIAVDLRPFIIDDLGLIATLRWFLRKFQNTYSDIRLDRRIGLEEHQIPESLKIVIFRIVQEGLNNVAKHSRAQRVHVALRRVKDRIELLIKDNGIGMRGHAKESQASCDKGFGLSSMKERTEYSGGRFRLDTEPDVGTSIRASWPLKLSAQHR